MKKITIIILLIIFSQSCTKEKSYEKSKSKVEKKSSQIETQNSLKKIGDYMSDEKDFVWTAKQSDTASYLVKVIFQKEFAVYQFNGQCYYWFFTKHYHTKEDKVELLWTYKSDCLLDMKFLESSNAVKKYPKNGDSFCEYTLVNDSVIKVKYLFPEWIKKINEKEKDSIFPKYLYLEKKDSL